MIALHQVGLNPAEAAEGPFSAEVADNEAAWREKYEKALGIVLKNKLRNFPKMPGSLGLTQMRRQMPAPKKK